MPKAPSKKKPPAIRKRKSCNCVKSVNEQLKDFNTELVIGHSINFVTGSLGQHLFIVTAKLDAKSRKPAKKVVCAYCPFCGRKY